MRPRVTRALMASTLAGLLAAATMLVAQPAATARTGAPQNTIQQCTDPAWNAGAVYVGGDRVSHDGNAWRAKWWTQGEEPGTTGQWGVWEDLGPCDEDPPTDPPSGECTDPAWVASAVYTGGDQVSHDGNAWRAKWWTQGEAPGTADVWEDLGECDGDPPTDPPTDPPPPGDGSAAPYLHLGWGDPPDAATVMADTGVRAFTMAFMLSGGGCNPAWDSQRPLHGGVDEQVINQIRANGGDVIVSFGGWSGDKLGPNCASAAALAGAIQQVIDAYDLDSVDMDVENIDEFENATVQDRILGALRIVKQDNPGITTIVTIPTLNTGPNFWGTRLIEQSEALGAEVDVFNIMTFNFGGGGDMFGAAVGAAQGLNTTLRSTFGWSEATAYQHMGITAMIGRSDSGEITTPGTFTQIRDWAQQRNLAELSFWSTNRDRPCPGGGTASNCSGIAQSALEFTRIAAQFRR